MSLVETVTLGPSDPSIPAHIALYRDVRNASFLRQQLISGNTEFQYAFIEASMIFSRNHLLAAVYRAIQDYQKKRLKSNNVHSEIVFSLNPNSNIAESFRKFGVSDKTTDLLVVKVSTSPDITHDTVSQHLGKVIEGTPCAFDDANLRATVRENDLKKAYKLGSVNIKLPQRPANPNEESAPYTPEEREGIKRFESMLISAIALRGAT